MADRHGGIVVAETVVGATIGVVPSPKGYWKAMKSVCDKYGALLIFDEVMFSKLPQERHAAAQKRSGWKRNNCNKPAVVRAAYLNRTWTRSRWSTRVVLCVFCA